MVSLQFQNVRLFKDIKEYIRQIIETRQYAQLECVYTFIIRQR